MSFVIRFRHPITGDLIQKIVWERPGPVYKVPVARPMRLLPNGHEDVTDRCYSVAVYELRRVYPPIYDYWRVS